MQTNKRKNVSSRLRSHNQKTPKKSSRSSYNRLLSHSHNPIPPNEIGKKDKRIESYLLHTSTVYQNGLIRKRKKNELIDVPKILLNNSDNNADMKNEETQNEDIISINRKDEVNQRIKDSVDDLYKQLHKSLRNFTGENTHKYEEQVGTIAQIEDMETFLTSLKRIIHWTNAVTLYHRTRILCGCPFRTPRSNTSKCWSHKCLSIISVV